MRPLRAVPRRVSRRALVEIARYRYAREAQLTPDDLLGRAVPAGDVAAAVASFRAGEGARFFFDRRECGAIVAALDRVVPGWSERTIAAATRIANRTVRLFGADVDLGAGRLPWHDDVLNGYRWDPTTFYRTVPIPYGRADIKVPWELSRCQHLPTVAMAYAASRERRFAAEVVAQIDDWIDANPTGYGVNWACTMDVAIRAVNWLWAYELIADAADVSDEFLGRFLSSLLAHGRHVHRNIERYRDGITTNHTLADYVGLLYLGLLLPQLADAREWREEGARGVVECMEAQVFRDGVQFESAIAYHRFTLEMLAGSSVLASRNDRRLPESFTASLERMIEFVLHYTRPDGLAPLVGDNDDGRLQILGRYFDWQPQDHRYLLGIGTVLFDRADFAAVARGGCAAPEETCWLLGPDAWDAVLDRSGQPTVTATRAFPDGGRYVFRHLGHHALVSADEVGTAGLGNHKHNDIFSFELSVDGTAIVVDPGTYLYTSDRAARDGFRATAAHNTFVVDGAEQNAITEWFGMRRDAHVEVTAWVTSQELDVFDGLHTGYRRLPSPVVHRRCIGFVKQPFAWVVIDTLVGDGAHAGESYLHFAADVEPLGSCDPDRAAPALPALTLLTDAVGITATFELRDRLAATFRCDDTSIVVVPFNWTDATTSTGWIAPRYGHRVEAPVLRLSGSIAAGSSAGYVILSAPWA
jgi:hypothetical protein